MEQGKVIGKEGGMEAAKDGRKFALSMGGEGCWKGDEKKRKEAKHGRRALKQALVS